jgi:hypothetical protein
LYVGNWDEKTKVVMRYQAKADGTLANGKLFIEYDECQGRGCAAIKVDQQGNLYVFRSGRTLGRFTGRGASWDDHGELEDAAAR